MGYVSFREGTKFQCHFIGLGEVSDVIQKRSTSPTSLKSSLHLSLMNWDLVVDELATNATGT